MVDRKFCNTHHLYYTGVECPLCFEERIGRYNKRFKIEERKVEKKEETFEITEDSLEKLKEKFTRLNK